MKNNTRSGIEMNRPTYYVIALTVVFAWMFIPEVAQAQIVEDNLLEDTLEQYRMGMTAITGNLGNILLNTFVLLATIEFTWGMIKNYIDNGGLQGFLSEVITRIMFIGLFYYLYLQGTSIPLAIVNSFKDLATLAIPGTATSFNPVLISVKV